MRKVPLGRFRPDAQDLLNGELEEALNCIPYPESYGPWPDYVEFTSALTARCQGAASTRGSDGVAELFAGDATKLYRLSGMTFNSVGRTVTYAASSVARWEFATFGNSFLAVNGTDAMQVWTLGSSSAFRDQSASASAPVATHIAAVRDFVMVGNLTSLPNRLQWSQINNALRWATSVPRQSDYQDLPGSGAKIQRITGGDFAAVLTEDDLWRGTYVGAPLVFRFDLVSPGLGCRAPGAVARFQNTTYFWSTMGFFSFDGQMAAPIGYEQVDGWFEARVNTGFLDRMSAVIDPVNKLYILAYPSVNSPDGTCDNLLFYSWAAGRWARAEVNTEFLYNGMSIGKTLEELDAIYGNLDAIPVSLDSELFQGGSKYLGMFSTTHKAASFEGDALDARWITGEMQLIEDSRAFIRAIKPLIQGNSASTISAMIGKRDRLIDSVTWSSASSMNGIGLCPIRSNGRFQRARLDVTGGFERAAGFDVDARREGVR